LGEAIEVGSLPDMLVWSPDGEKLLVANEAEPSDDYTVDPEGSVSIITLGSGVETAGFDGVPIDAEVRIFGPDASAAQDLGPEYIAVSDDSKTAWVTLQEKNAIAKLNIDNAQFNWVRSLGYKDHNAEGNGLDASNKDKGIDIQT
jgi:DNA-binding beta-propeller fold protein YncE